MSDTTTPTGPPPALEAVGLRKRFGATVAVADVDLRVGPHEVVCLVGPSGCGKSTVLRMIAGLVRPDGGEIRLGGQLLDGPAGHVAPEKRHIGVVFQDHALFPNLTVGDNVAFGLKGRERGAKRARVAEMLELVALGDHARRYPHELSGGERQRVALARALAPEPAVLLLDEPFASLDHNLRLQVRDQVLEILRTTGTPSVFVTHDQLEALALGDRVVVLRGGLVEQVGTPWEVFHRPVDRFVATFMGEADFLPVHQGNGGPCTDLGPIAVDGPVPDGVEVLIRPDDVDVEPDPEGGAVVEHVEFQGSWVLYRLRLASGATVRARRPHTASAAPGDRVVARWAAADHVPVLIGASDPGGRR